MGIQWPRYNKDTKATNANAKDCESLVYFEKGTRDKGPNTAAQYTQKTPGLVRAIAEKSSNQRTMLKDVARSLLSFAVTIPSRKHHNFSTAARLRMQVLASIGRSSVAVASDPNLLTRRMHSMINELSMRSNAFQ